MPQGTKQDGRKPGRPRGFDEGAVLDAAMRTFWVRGLAATSLDDLGRAMRMNRPSIANAFGDKETLYRRTLDHFGTGLRQNVAAILEGAPTLRGALVAFFDAALAVYCADTPALGCFVMCTAPTEAAAHSDVREDLRRLIGDLDDLLAARLRRGRADGDLSPDVEPRSGARIAQAVLHSIAIRARSGQSRNSLKALAREAVDLLVADG
jgi:AcrR family transcriptional regulator